MLAMDDNVNQFNAWLAYNPGDLTLALEFDIFDVYGDELWNLMFLANYQFVDWFGATFRYSHEDLEPFVGADSDADRFTLALLFSLTQNLFLNVEYSHTALDAKMLMNFTSKDFSLSNLEIKEILKKPCRFLGRVFLCLNILRYLPFETHFAMDKIVYFK